ncbi:hypothetical protein L7F22_066589 [Adiantum nelumboides]|nr:hypothetical protein [Adiantum nelumboides]
MNVLSLLNTHATIKKELSTHKSVPPTHAAVRAILPTIEQAHWNVKDAYAHALIVLSIKRTITPHIRSTKFAKEAWDILASHYAGRNEAKIALLRKELESNIMNEEDDMDTFLAGVKDVNEHLISAGALFKKTRSQQRAVEQAFIAAQRKGGNSNVATSHGSSASGKSHVSNASVGSNSSRNFGDKEWAFSAKCTYNPTVHDACMLIVADSHVWYFDSGATKHITSHRDLFTSLESVPHGNSVTCANNASHPVQRDGKIVLIVANGNSFTLVDTLHVAGIKKNLLSVFALARLGLVVKFVDDRCIVHDLNFGDEIVASGILCRGLYKLTLYDKCGQNFANAILDLKAISDAKLWHARFGHLNFANLLRLQKSYMIASLPPLEAPAKHVCEGCILGKMQHSKFPKDGSSFSAEMPLQIGADMVMHSQVVPDEDAFGTEVADSDRLAHIVHVLSAFGSLMSDLLVSRPDLAYAVGAFAVGVVSRAMTDTGIVHSGAF